MEEAKEFRVTVRFPRQDYLFLEQLVEDGEYTNIADAVRDAVKRMRIEYETRHGVNTLLREKALMAYKEDIENKSLADWMAAHTSFMLPLHRYRGEIILHRDSIFFRGEDKTTGKTHVLAFPISSINDIHHGFDDTYRRNDDRGLGIFSKPLRITFRENNQQKTIYLWIGFNRVTRTSSNRKWFEAISRLMRRTGEHSDAGRE